MAQLAKLGGGLEEQNEIKVMIDCSNDEERTDDKTVLLLESRLFLIHSLDLTTLSCESVLV